MCKTTQACSTKGCPGEGEFPQGKGVWCTNCFNEITLKQIDVAETIEAYKNGDIAGGGIYAKDKT